MYIVLMLQECSINSQSYQVLYIALSMNKDVVV